MSSLKSLLSHLVSCASVTPDDAGCQAFMMKRLQELGFSCIPLPHGRVNNFYASYGTGAPRLIFAGHTDVVPVGDAKKWLTEPFVLTEDKDLWYGRGVADMKGSLAAMLLMAEQFVTQNPDIKGSLGFLITSGEEGDDYDDGTPQVMTYLKEHDILPDYCIVGEPSSTLRVGDVVKIGRRGSLSGDLVLPGVQGHVAYPHLAKNPIHLVSPALAELAATTWDKGNKHFPPTSLQFTKINAGGQANNIIPGQLELQFNFRFSTEQTATSLQQAVTECFSRHELHPEISWRYSGAPFLTNKGKLLDAVNTTIEELTGTAPEQSTSGGTSDGRFIAPFGVEVVELGPVNASIHQVNEWVSKKELELLTTMYFEITKALLTN